MYVISSYDSVPIHVRKIKMLSLFLQCLAIFGNVAYRRCSSQTAYNENRRFSGEPKQKMMGTCENRVRTYTQRKLRKRIIQDFLT